MRMLTASTLGHCSKKPKKVTARLLPAVRDAFRVKKLKLTPSVVLANSITTFYLDARISKQVSLV